MYKYLKNVSWLMTLLVPLVIVSCSDDDPTPSGAYESGIFIINEGNFGDGDGSISFYNRSDQSIENTIFQSVNDEAALGDVIQSMDSDGGISFLVANNSNKIEAVSTTTFESLYTITDVGLPRYVRIVDGMAYVTEWGSLNASFQPTDGNLLIFDASTGTLDREIDLDNGSEDVEISNGRAIVSNTTGTLSIVDLSNDEVTQVELSTGPGGIVIDSDGFAWVACGGGFTPEFAPTNDGAIYKVNVTTGEIAEDFQLNRNFSSKIAISSTGDVIYYMVGNSVYALNSSATDLPMDPLFMVEGVFSFYGIGVDPQNDNVYVSDAKDFIQDGEVYVYNNAGSFQSSFTAGRIPNGFSFN